MKKSGFSRTSLASLAVCVSLVSVIAGCGGGKTESTTSPDKKAAEAGATASVAGKKDDEKVTIHILTRYAGDDSHVGPLKDAKDAFIKLHPNVTIQDDSVAEEAAYNNKLKTAIATGETPGFFYYPSVAGLADWAKNGLLMDITPLMADKSWSDGFISNSFEVWNLEKFGVKGHYAIPVEFAPEVVYYNPDLFAKAGITKLPETMDDLNAAIDKLNAANIIPFGTGAKDTWRTGHIHNNIIYRTVGVDKVKDLGTRKAKWTDPDVVQSLAILKDMKTKGAFQKGFEGIDYNTEKSDFLAGKSAMSVNGSWMIGEITNSNSPYKDKISFFPFPSLKDKPQFKSDSVMFNVGFMLSGTMKGLEKDMTIEFAKFFTGKEQQQNKLDKAKLLGSRTDTTSPEDAPKIFKDMVSYMTTIKEPGGDYFDYDPDPALTDTSRNAIIDMLLKFSPEEAAKKVQDEIDKYEAKKK
ncbi:extracellular solute-binding protein [Paenibacillus andongensis]|uniref:extracellular solute-binding protein n=1 Tax=Paenibacillus andongensis TaxID=2975482 RepID=UPI0021BAAE26|nr:extracellular solute-binding protein [Paenibacillus andongensis]